MIFISKLKIKIEGKNLKKIVKKIRREKINIYSYSNLKDYIEIIIDKEDYIKLYKIIKINDLKFEVIDSIGYIKYKSKLLSNKYLLIFILLGIILLKILTNIIFDIEIIEENNITLEFIKNELYKNGIKKYSFKKSYKEIQKIKQNILDENKDKIEWLEIEDKGCKYVVRINLRKREKKETQKNISNIVSSKSGIIKKIITKKGVSLVNVNDYVKKGDILISGSIKLNDITKGSVIPDGKVYAETWYNVKVEYPFHYKEIKKTGKTKNVYVIKFLNKNFELTFNKLKQKEIKENLIISFFPFSLYKQNQEEIIKKDIIYTKEEATLKALEKAKEQILKKLNNDEYIIYQKILLINVKDSKIIIEVFFSVYEDITELELE